MQFRDPNIDAKKANEEAKEATFEESMDKDNDDDEVPKDKIPEYVTFEESRDEENEVPKSKNEVPKKESSQDKIKILRRFLKKD